MLRLRQPVAAGRGKRAGDTTVSEARSARPGVDCGGTPALPFGMAALKLLVTGGAGFIGSNFIRYFLDAHPDCAVLNLDKLTYAANLDNLSEVASRPNYQFVQGDICDPDLVGSLLRQDVEAVVHLAAETHVDRSIADARAFVETNVVGTYTLLEAARQKGVRRFLHVSTDEGYGSLAPGREADEQAPLQPSSPYAAS